MRLLDYSQTRALLQKHGIACAKGVYCAGADEVLKESKTVPKPWVLKVMGKNVLHKTEKSLIALDLHDFEHLYHAAQRLEANARSAGLGKGEWGFLLQSKINGVELIIGGKRDAAFGKTVLFGSGGVAVELFKDFSTRVCPIAESDALEMIEETKASAYFTREGFRGRKASRQKIVELLLKTSGLLESEKQIESLDFNPVIADAQNAWVVDAKITVGE
ncbi:MAG: acetate--CoA ligase family protein [Candidatus Norongarragalinales archaeon]